jgi:hypothetical protein
VARKVSLIAALGQRLHELLPPAGVTTLELTQHHQYTGSSSTNYPTQANMFFRLM